MFAQHSRATSNSVISDQEPQDKQTLQSALRDAAGSDTITSEIRNLRSEIRKLERENRRLYEAANAAAAAAAVTGDAESSRALQVGEMERLKTSHQVALAALESTHASELAKIHTELETHRTQSSKLEGVESKIQAVETALRESKTRASQKEQALQQTIDQKDADQEQLAMVVEELKVEIDKCQALLDAEAARQEGEKAEAEERFERELEIARRSGVESEAEKMDLEAELAKVREEGGVELGRLGELLGKSEAALLAMQEDLASTRSQHLDELEQANQQSRGREEAARSLNEELSRLKELREAEQKTISATNEESRKTIEELQDAIGKLQRGGDDGSRVIETLQAQLQEHQQKKEDLAAKHETELRELQQVIESLQNDSIRVQQSHQEALARKDNESDSMNAVILDLQNKAITLQQSLEDAQASKTEATAQLTGTIEFLRQEAVAHKQRYEDDAAATEQERTDLTRAVEELQDKIQEYQHAATDADQQSKQASVEMAKVVEGLQDELQVLHHRLHEQNGARLKAEEEMKVLSEAHTSLASERNRLMKLCEESEEQIQAHSRSLGEKSLAVETLQAPLHDAQAAKDDSSSSLANLQEELGGLQRVLKSSHRDAEEQNGLHSSTLVELRTELERSSNEMRALQATHADTLKELRDTLGEQHILTTQQLKDEIDSLNDGKAVSEKALFDLQTRHELDIEIATRQHEGQQQGLRDEMAASHEGHIDAVQKLETAHAQRLEDMTQQHTSELAEVQAAADKRAEEVVGAERDLAHGNIIADMQVEHSEALASLTATLQPRGDASTATASPAMPADRSSPFRVNRSDSPSAKEGSGVAGLETPLAASPIGDEVYEPTPAYPRGGRRAGAQEVIEEEAGKETLRRENQRLLTELRAAEAEVGALRASLLSSTGSAKRGLNLTLSTVGAVDAEVVKSSAELEDPFAPSSDTQLDDSTLLRDLEVDEEEDDDPWDGNMTLEGTLECLRVQTEQLLEVHDDFLAENRSWSQQLKLARREHKSRDSHLGGEAGSPAHIASAS